MGIVATLTQLREGWLSRVSHHLAKGVGIREIFLDQLNRFYNALIEAAEVGNPAWLDPVLSEWANSRTQTELAESAASLSPILTQIWNLTYEYLREALPTAEALEAALLLLPVMMHSYEWSARIETERRVDHVAQELAHVQQQLEQIDKSKSDFISLAAHELKTPLTLIEGYGSMLREIFPKDDESTYAVLLLKGIDNGTRRLREIVDDMIDVSLIDNNLLSLNFQPVWINRLLKSIAEEMQEVLLSRRQEVVIDEFPGLGEPTFADPERLYQAFRNLLNNAIKYTPDGGKITISGRKLPGFLEITFQDTGIGIDPEDHLRIFQKFGQLGSVSLHSSSKVKFKGGGPGLGLPITKGIIEAHGGAIWVESDRHDEAACPGSIFHLMLPIRKDFPDDKTAKLFKAIMES